MVIVKVLYHSTHFTNGFFFHSPEGIHAYYVKIISTSHHPQLVCRIADIKNELKYNSNNYVGLETNKRVLTKVPQRSGKL